MVYDVEILNILRFTRDDIDLCRISYRLLNPDTCSNNARFKGYPELSFFVDNGELFNNFDVKLCGKALKIETELVQNEKDPSKSKVVLKKIKSKDNEDLYILQS